MACASAVFPPDKASRCIYVTAPVVHATCTRTLPGHLTRSVELQSLARSSHRDFRNSGQVLCCATQQLGFHQQRLAAEVLKQQDRQPPLTVTVRFVIAFAYSRHQRLLTIRSDHPTGKRRHLPSSMLLRGYAQRASMRTLLSEHSQDRCSHVQRTIGALLS